MTSRHDAVDHAIDLLERELRAERFADHLELKAERFGSPEGLVTEHRCFTCGGLVIPNVAGFWVHVTAGLCSHVVLSVEEASR